MTQEELWYFRHNGFHRVARTLPRELVARLNAATDAQIESMAEPIVWETGAQSRTPTDVRRLSKILSRDPVYLEAATHAIVLDALTGVLGDNIELLTNKHNHLMVRPAGSAPVPWHSGEELHEPTLITALVYLQASTIDNGCVRLVPGSHLRPFAQPRRPGGGFRRSPLYRRSLPVPMPAGGVLLFNDCCFHGSDINGSAESRRSMTLGYRAHDSHDVLKDDPEKILVRGERAYTGHPHPFPQPAKTKKRRKKT